MTYGTVEYHTRMAPFAAERAVEFLVDPHAAAREFERKFREDHPDALPHDDPYPFTCGYAISMIGALLDALGYPQQGPIVNQWSWVYDADDEDDAWDVAP